ncbi:hypothetical protein DM02DRAFT_649778 [Periconia macrospinosa]|uniref:Uncharacterized protein n=1 Tax=Periconia macrospinosa TaxID=97972 RepID=A0A2V1EAK5_9PLEO|nr:hypothetical protein DM02DRAFT_649778 [Periconia macrospinosa]
MNSDRSTEDSSTGYFNPGTDWWSMPYVPSNRERSGRRRNSQHPRSTLGNRLRGVSRVQASPVRTEAAEDRVRRARIRRAQAERIVRSRVEQRRHRLGSHSSRVSSRSIANRNDRLAQVFGDLVEQIDRGDQHNTADIRTGRDYDSLVSLMSQVNLSRRSAHGTENLSDLFSRMNISGSSSGRQQVDEGGTRTSK